MMEFELLRSFVAVAECGGFHRAAAFRFARRSAHCASRKRIGLADRLHEPQSYGVRAAALAPLGLSKAETSLFAHPFRHIATTRDEDGKTVQELREALGERAGPRWWEPHWPRPEMRSRIQRLRRYIVTAETVLC